jgi:dihydroorotate dehydrogenase electron transfer subunit
MVNCGQDCVLPRPFSVHQVINKEDLALYFAVLEGGKGTKWLSQRKVDDSVKLLGPLGNSFSVRSASHNLLLVAGGMGIAPLYFLAQETLNAGYSVTLVYGTAVKYRYPEDHLPSGIRLIATTEDGAVGKKGKVTDLLPEFAGWADQVFACGPLSMYRDMAQRKRQLELEGKPVQISLEVVMGCGHGVCYGCTIRTKKGLKQVCKDGPVFDLDDIIWEEMES